MQTTQGRNPGLVVRLPGANQPHDRGITSLGVLMQLAGTIGVAVMLAAAVVPLLGYSLGTMTDSVACVDTVCSCDAGDAAAAADPRDSSDAPILFLIAIACVARSLFHRAAGIALVHASEDIARRHLGVYGLVAAAHTAVILVFLHTFGAGATMLVAAAGALVAWPATLHLVARSRRFSQALAHRGDSNFEGVGVLLIAMAAIAGAGLLLGVSSVVSHTGLTGGPATLGLFAIAGLLAARTAAQLAAGKRLCGDVSLRGALAAIRAYRRVSAVTTLAIVLVLVTYAAARGSATTAALGLVVVPWLLLAWPTTLARLSEERAFAADMALDEPLSYRIAADRGLVSFGWLMLAVGSISLALSLPTAVLAGGSWWLAAVSAVEVWAALELLGMTPRHPQVVMTAGLFGLVVVLFTLWPQANALLELRAPMTSGHELAALASQQVFACCIHLGVAIAAILLASRVQEPFTAARARPTRPKRHR